MKIFIFTLIAVASVAQGAEQGETITSANDLKQGCVYSTNKVDENLSDFGRDTAQDETNFLPYTKNNSFSIRKYTIDGELPQKYENCPLAIIEKSKGADRLFSLTSVRGANKELCVYAREIYYYSASQKTTFLVICPAKQ